MSELKQVEGRAKFGPYETWYRVTGDLNSGKPPIFILHGGPGAAHNYVDSYKLLSRDGRAVIHYDQLGCGNSTLLPDKGADFWTPQLFVDELENLVDYLGPAQGLPCARPVLGRHAGGRIWHAPAEGTEVPHHRQFAGLDGAVGVARRCASAREMPQDIQDALNKHEKAGTYSDPEYQKATMWVYERHVCRVVPFPPEVTATFDQIGRNPTVYHTMNGPNEFFVIGTLKDWNIIPELHKINVPTLIISGRHDEATPACVQPYADNIKGSRWVIFENSSHMPHVEEKELCMKTVGDFLDAND